ncbi:MAG TPA: glycosyltransferase, partial [Methylibium sp.]|nr:glycosyltransferase [Methylibium sp.]
MKTLHVESGMHLYGGALQVVFLLRGLQARGEQPVLACPEGSAIAGAVRALGVPVHEIAMRGDLDVGMAGRLRALIRTERPALVHLHSRRGSDLWGGLAARRESVPAVLSRRVDNPEPRWWVAAKYRLYAKVVAISEGIRRVLLAEGLGERQVVCVHSAVDTEAYRPEPADRTWLRAEFGLADDEPVLAMAAQFIPRKGHRTLLAALPAVLAAQPRLRALLFGQGPELDAIRAQVAAA